MNEHQKDAIASVFSTQKFNKNQEIINEGEPGSAYYLIKEVKL